MGFLDVIKNLDFNKCGLNYLSEEQFDIVHKIYIDMLREFDEICRNNGIDWVLTGGNALGAVRYKGFIPWDDDIDIAMTRKNYEKLKDVFSKRNDQVFVLQNPGDKDYIFHFPRIYNMEVSMKGLQSLENRRMGLNIDIFIIENTPDNMILRKLHGLLCTIFLVINSSVRIRKCSRTISRHSGGDKELLSALRKRKIIGLFFCFLSLEKWAILSDKVFSIVKKDTTKNVVIPTGRKHYFGEIYNREDMCYIRNAKFEGLDLYLPAGVENYLTSLYGADYMIPPEEGKREKHPYVEVDLSGRNRFGGAYKLNK